MKIKDYDQKCYLVKSGEVKKRAEAHRTTFLRLRQDLWKVVERYGCTKASICDTMMVIRGLCFDGPVPDGWCKPKHGISYPKRGAIPPEDRKYFAPSGSYTVETHQELRAFTDWLKCPFSYNWHSKDGKSKNGFRNIGRLFSHDIMFWYDPKGPIMLELPDVAGARKRAEANGEVVENGGLDWTPPKGLKEILPEKWDLMAAEHKQKTEKKS